MSKCIVSAIASSSYFTPSPTRLTSNNSYRYVSAIHIPKFAPETLISGGGDPCLKIWNWMSGECADEIQIWDTVEPFIAVKNNKRKRGDNDEDEGGGAGEKRKGKGKKSKKRATKRGMQAKKIGEVEGEGAGNERQDEDEAEEINETVIEAVEEKVLVVSKIETIQRGNTKFVVFSAIG
jgi:tRNA (guanine-N(7)-)-methyltransferase subunit TRM82